MWGRNKKPDATRKLSGRSDADIAGTKVLIDVAMRDYLAVREDMWGLRRLSSSIFAGVIATVAVALSAAVVLVNKPFDHTILSFALLAAALLIELISFVLLGIDGSFKIAEDLNRLQASEIRALLERVSPPPIPRTVLGFQETANDIGSSAPSRVWLPSYGAWGMQGWVLSFLAAASVVSGVLVAFSNNGGPGYASLLLSAIDVLVGLALAAVTVLNWQLPARLKDQRDKKDRPDKPQPTAT